MTVGELIDELMKYPKDAEIVVVHSEWPIKKISFDYDQLKEASIVKVQ